jgi:hypothetical protein
MSKPVAAFSSTSPTNLIQWLPKAINAVLACNVLHVSTTISPVMLYFGGLGIGIGLLVASMAVGMGSFNVELEIVTTNETIPKSLDLGYASQLNYGLWYVVLCPILLSMVALAYDAMRRAQQTYPEMLPAFEKLGHFKIIKALGILILCFFVFKNIFVEWGDYKRLGLGWVQAKVLQDYRNEMQTTGQQIDLIAKGKTFDRFLLPRQERFIAKDSIKQVKITKIDPTLNVAGSSHIVAFVVITKLWVGLWEAIVIYFGIMTFLWGMAGAMRMNLSDLKDDTHAFYHLSWIRRPALYIFLSGILVNFFCVFRYVANATKGSYGKWDQYWSFLIFSPVLFLIPASLVISRVYNSSNNEEQAYLSKRVGIVAAVWSVSFAYVVYLILGYINPNQQEILVACFKPIINLFKSLFGL